MKSYTLNLPPNYIKPKLPGGKAWVNELRNGGLQQTESDLAIVQDDEQMAYCCLGVLCKLQGRLREVDGVFRDDMSAYFLQEDNELEPIIGRQGYFRFGVEITVEGFDVISLADCNDSGLTFLQIADIIEAVWECE